MCLAVDAGCPLGPQRAPGHYTGSPWPGLPGSVAVRFPGWASQELEQEAHHLGRSSLRAVCHTHTTGSGERTQTPTPDADGGVAKTLSKMSVWGGVCRGCRLCKIQSSTLILNRRNNAYVIECLKAWDNLCKAHSIVAGTWSIVNELLFAVPVSGRGKNDKYQSDPYFEKFYPYLI